MAITLWPNSQSQNFRVQLGYNSKMWREQADEEILKFSWHALRA